MFTTITQSLKLIPIFTMDSDTYIAPMNPQIDSPSINSKNSENELNNYNFEVLHVNFEKLSKSFSEKYSKISDISLIRIENTKKFFQLLSELKKKVKRSQNITNDFLKKVLDNNTTYVNTKYDITMYDITRYDDNYNIITENFKTNKRLFIEIEREMSLFSPIISLGLCIPKILENDETLKIISNIAVILSKISLITKNMIDAYQNMINFYENEIKFYKNEIKFYENRINFYEKSIEDDCKKKLEDMTNSITIIKFLDKVTMNDKIRNYTKNMLDAMKSEFPRLLKISVSVFNVLEEIKSFLDENVKIFEEEPKCNKSSVKEKVINAEEEESSKYHSQASESIKEILPTFDISEYLSKIFRNPLRYKKLKESEINFEKKNA